MIMGLISGAALLVMILAGIGLIALIAIPFALAFCVLGVLLKVAFFVLFLPFRLLGGLVKVGLASAGVFLGVLFVLGGLGFLLLLGALPLLPLLLIAGGLGLVFRAMRSGPAVSSSPGR
jgi:hypothetical protein